ncbi:ATP-dependent zinc protease [Agarivorans sp. 1_MG-2023]|uniref:ATP-dependent zinc protease family protein n=1 Tax=Agarivorans sp. 1_MG-2023 TaxID=3062634 RepID=UPI0026E2E9BB|nr:RimK/LysX family protein [Agarivorans sp. 1_MG-2023]MDO6764013.1 RimK/LysX family protein [Agarivorans sp. 1_MG-2023]
MKKLSIISLSLALSACASQQASQPNTETLEQLSALSAQQTSVFSQCESISEQLAAQQQRFDQLEEKVVAIVPAPVSSNKATAPSCSKQASYKLGNKTVLGESEWVSLQGQKHAFQARIDTGAATSSLNATDIVKFERDGKNWVRFNLRHKTIDTDIIVERPVIRTAEVTQASTNTVDKRPVVSMLVKLGPISEKAQFTLTDRNHLSYPVLLGRSFLKDISVVDISQKFTQAKPTFKD